jgi:hypothetical protein
MQIRYMIQRISNLLVDICLHIQYNICVIKIFQENMYRKIYDEIRVYYS